MDSTKIALIIQRSLQDIHKAYPIIASIVKDIHFLQGRSLLVGGAVRDMILGLPIKDLDIEMHNISLDQLEGVLKKYGQVNYIGKAFGVFRLVSFDIDWSIPRTDLAGRKPQVVINPNLSIRQAFSRRDLTMNAMGIDLYSQEFIDPFNGLDDIQLQQLRTPNSTLFIQDPLRFYRVMQFIGRFEFSPDQQLNDLCKTMNLQNIAPERISIELYKLLLKSKYPSRGIRWILSLGRLGEIFPMLGKLVEVHQDIVWHPEGDVFEHSMQSVDAAAHICATNSFFQHSSDKFILLMASLCHDLGKPKTTKIAKGRIRSFNHEVVGAALTAQFLKKLCYPHHIIESIKKLIRYHMIPLQLIAQDSSATAYKRLAFKLAPQTTVHMLTMLCYADKWARVKPPSIQSYNKIIELEKFIEYSTRLGIYFGMEKPLLRGIDILPFVQEGRLIGQLLKRAYNYQIKHTVHDKQQMYNWLKVELLNQSVLKKND